MNRASVSSAPHLENASDAVNARYPLFRIQIDRVHVCGNNSDERDGRESPEADLDLSALSVKLLSRMPLI